MGSFIDRGDFLGADDLNVWKQLARNDPASPALLPLARSYLFREEPGRALEISSRIFSAHPYHLEAAILTARALLELGRADEAREAMANGSVTLDLFADHLEEVARVLAAIGETDQSARAEKAVEALRTSRRADIFDLAFEEEGGFRNEPEAIPTETMASLYLGQGHAEKALDIYRLLVEQNPENERLRIRLEEMEAEYGQGEDIEEAGIATFPEPETETDLVAVLGEISYGTEDVLAFDEADWDAEDLPPLEGMSEEGELPPAEDETDWSDIIPPMLEEEPKPIEASADLEDADWSDLIPPIMSGRPTGPEFATKDELDFEALTNELMVLSEEDNFVEEEPETATGRVETEVRAVQPAFAPDAAGEDVFSPKESSYKLELLDDVEALTEEEPTTETDEWLDAVAPDHIVEDEALALEAEVRTGGAPAAAISGTKNKLIQRLERLRTAARRRREAVEAVSM